MSTNNSFQQLAQQEEEQYPQAPPETERGVMGNVRALGFVTNVIELYLPRIFEMFIAIFGGADDKSHKSKNNIGGILPGEEDFPDGEGKQDI